MSFGHNLTQYVDTWKKIPKTRFQTQSNMETFNSTVIAKIPKSVWRDCKKKHREGKNDIFPAIQSFIAEAQLPLSEIFSTRNLHQIQNTIDWGFSFHGTIDSDGRPLSLPSISKGEGSDWEKIVHGILDRHPDVLRFNELWYIDWAGEVAIKQRQKLWGNRNEDNPKRQKNKAEHHDREGSKKRRTGSEQSGPSSSSGTLAISSSPSISQTLNSSTNITSNQDKNGHPPSQTPVPNNIQTTSVLTNTEESGRTADIQPTEQLQIHQDIRQKTPEPPHTRQDTAEDLSKLEPKQLLERAREAGIPECLAYKKFKIDEWSQWEARRTKFCTQSCKNMSFLRAKNRPIQKCLGCWLKEQENVDTEPQQENVDTEPLGPRVREPTTRQAELDDYEAKERDEAQKKRQARQDDNDRRANKRKSKEDRQKQQQERSASLKAVRKAEGERQRLLATQTGDANENDLPSDSDLSSIGDKAF